MIIDQELLNHLSDEARKNSRLRASFDLRNSTEDLSQRMLNAIEPGTVIPIHRHQHSSETLIIIRGKLREFLYDESGALDKVVEMEAGGTCTIMQIEKGQWHSLECLKSGTIIFEAKDGPYMPISAEDILDNKIEE
ncbi:WbuC family cupin fold metalloprotein [Bacteroides sp. OF04-15BH]|jgi:cupin fold WbuC family metalloprotein|uniref:WbuC family cupin fold metalloprotein n=1 Tax=Bacteroides sp. OF04-15BH TaxID=2292281 RepID=UPI000E481C13|nr:WbuC family cupin fold metalloprotein [Bacteroides sp. OF04-15BH]RHP62182.1 cupin fold metalloprotein, WbuC family [Bacteroides sp. OF04-15BH]